MLGCSEGHLHLQTPPIDMTQHTKTRGPPYRVLQSLDAPFPKGGTLHEYLPDRGVWLYGDDDEDDNTLDVLAAVLEATMGIAPSSKLVSPRLSRVFSSSITANRTRQLLRSIYDNGGDRVLKYIFGLEDGRRFARSRTSLEPLEPARQLWPSGAAQQNARKLLDRVQATLRANLLIVLATHDEKLFLDYLFYKFPLKEGWRKGTVDRLSHQREQLDQQVPEQAAALSELTMPALGRAIVVINNFRQLVAGGAGAVQLFTSVYAAFRYVGLFSDQGTEAAGILHSASSNLPQGGSAETLMLKRALERPLHLLEVPEEWDAFIARLLDWLQDPRGAGAVFAAYTACYYLDSLDAQSWQRMSDPFSIERAWTKEALRAVLEESYRNLGESWYRAPHHTVINTLRALNYLRAYPNQILGHRQRIVCLCLARAGISAASQLSHRRVNEVRRWFKWFEKESL